MTDQFDPTAYAKKYYGRIENAEYPRLKAWEFVYEYVWDESRSWSDLLADEQIDTTALHIGFYLANWGMYRGSSGLLNDSNLDQMKALARVLFSGLGPEVLELGLNDFAPSAPQLKHNQQKLNALFSAIEGLGDNVTWTTTLKTKILLGVWGQFPAIDRYYLAACRDLFPNIPLLTKASGEGLTALATLVEERGIKPYPTLRTDRLGIPYPTARFMDMALFEYGLQLEHAVATAE